MKQRVELENTWIKEAKEYDGNRNIQDLILDTDKKPSAVKSVFRAANILVCLSRGVSSITDIANYCKLNKATVHRLLKALVESRLALQDPINHRYYLGYSIDQIISDPMTTHEYLRTCAFKPMTMLSDTTEETVILCVSIGLQYIILSEIPSKHGLRVFDGKKGGSFLHAGATSKILLSQLSDSDLEIALENMKMEPMTSQTVTDKEKLLDDIKRIRRLGYNVSVGERIKGSMAIGAPVTNYFLPVAIGIVGPESRIKPRRKEYIKVLQIAAAQVSENLERALHIMHTKKFSIARRKGKQER